MLFPRRRLTCRPCSTAEPLRGRAHVLGDHLLEETLPTGPGSGCVCRRALLAQAGGVHEPAGPAKHARALDGMILSGGLNIYSKEVEQAIMAHPAVADVAVVGTADPQFGEAVVAFVELKRGAHASQDEIVKHCQTLIASNKKPKYVFFDGFPKNAQGKALKRELREKARDLAPTA